MKKPRLHFTIKMAKELDACEEGLDMLYKYLADNNIQYNDDTKFNVLILLKSNNIDHLWWLLRNGKYDHKEISVELANRCAKRAKEYADYAAANAANAASYAARVAAIADDYAVCVASAAACASNAANAAHAAAYADAAAACAANAAANVSAYSRESEREKQAEDFKELLDDGDIK